MFFEEAKLAHSDWQTPERIERETLRRSTLL
jgi:hypothetical protein